MSTARSDLNLEKFELQPARRRGYLGMDLYSTEALTLPFLDRVLKFQIILEGLPISVTPSAKSWFRVIGHMVSLEKTYGTG